MTAGVGPLSAGARIAEFRIVREIGAGGFGITYLAMDETLAREVALKEYLPGEWGIRRADGTIGPRSSASADNYAWGLQRFTDEARALARMDDPGIVRVHRVIEAAGTAYIVMEYVKGDSLADALQRSGPLADTDVRALLTALAHGLATVHAAGLLHRDIKPQNIMLRAADGSPVLIDFGAARQQVGRHSRPLTAVLTPGYAPMEQYSVQGRQGPWTDIYALGAVAYQAITGRVPDDAPDRLQQDRLVPVREAAPHPVTPGLSAAVDAALSVHIRDRPRDVNELLAMLMEEQEPAAPQEPLVPHRPVPKSDAGGPESIVVGREDGCDLRVRDASVSRRHAQVTRLPDGFYVTDLGTTNGTFVLHGTEWRMVQEAFAAPSDHLRFGRFEISVAQLVSRFTDGRYRASGSGYEHLDPHGPKMRDPATGEVLDRSTRTTDDWRLRS